MVFSATATLLFLPVRGSSVSRLAEEALGQLSSHQYNEPG
jgi:hypothetical protein